MRQRNPLSPEEARELDALDRALAGEPVDADLRELANLVHDVRATAPQMSPGFAASLEHRVAEGFPKADEQPAPRRSRRRLAFLPAAGVLAAALVALVVVVGSGGDSPGPARFAGDESAGGVAANQAAAPQALAEGPESSADAGAPARDRAAGPQPLAEGPESSADAGAVSRDRAAAPAAPAATGARKVQRSAELVLGVATDKVDSTSDAVIRTVDRFDGIVATSRIATDDSTGGEATFVLRIPTERLDDALAALSKLGHVTQRSQDLVDITAGFTSVQDRLSDARAERRGLLRALGRASTQQQIDSLRARLRIVRRQIARLNGDLEALRRRANLATVNVTVQGDGSQPEGGGSGGSWSPGDAARDALRVLEVMVGVALVALAIVVPLALLALMGAFGVRATRRKRRESALDAA